MDKRYGVPNRRYPPEFKLKAIRLAETVGVNEAAKRLGIPQSSIGNWLRITRRGATVAPTKSGADALSGKADIEVKNARLRRELANAKLDLEIVKKAAVYFEGVAVKYAWIEEHSDVFSVSRTCRHSWMFHVRGTAMARTFAQQAIALQ